MLDKASKLLLWLAAEAGKGPAAALLAGPPSSQSLEQVLPAAPEPGRLAQPEDKGKKGRQAAAAKPQAPSSAAAKKSGSGSAARADAAASRGFSMELDGSGTAHNKAALECHQLRAAALLLAAQVARLQWEHGCSLELALAASQAVQAQSAAGRNTSADLSHDERELLHPGPRCWLLAMEQVTTAYLQLRQFEHCLEVAAAAVKDCTAAGRRYAGSLWDKHALVMPSMYSLAEYWYHDC